jgi:hypothetical protein
MGYQYDIFISYRRNDETRRWIDKHFDPLLKFRVGEELGHEPTTYIDTQLEVGASWPAQLANAHGGSRILIALWSGSYFASPWCTHEMTLMLQREKDFSLRTPSRPHGLVLPVIIHDGEKFPPELRHIQCCKIQKFFSTRMSRTGTSAERLDKALVAHAHGIAQCIRSAPTWQQAWQEQAGNTLFNEFYQQAAVQLQVPRFTNE